MIEPRRFLIRMSIFLIAVLALVIIFGSTMYLIEGEGSKFVSIPRGIYWAIVTLTTVGYGDYAPATLSGRLVARPV